uniref:Uncharacterized protein n=1 Tax=Cucumis melo TaxID=3656 RepID=A0A9I9EAS6_CUCME
MISAARPALGLKPSASSVAPPLKKELEELARNAGGAVNENKDGAAERPSNTLNTNAAAYRGRILTLASDHSKNSNIQKQKSSNELGNNSPIKGPPQELFRVEEGSRRMIEVVAGGKTRIKILRHY